MIVSASELLTESQTTTQTELEVQVSNFISKISEALGYYALGENIKEILVNEKNLKDLQQSLIFFSAKIKDSKHHNNTYSQRMSMLRQTWEQQIEQWELRTSEKVGYIGMTLEDHKRFLDALSQGDIDHAVEISQEADKRINQSMPMWSIEVVRDASRTIQDDERTKLHKKVIDHFFKEIEKRKETESDTHRPTLIIQAGLPGSGKSSPLELLELVYGKVIVADLDEIRTLLDQELRHSQHTLFSEDSSDEYKKANPHRYGYNEADQTIVQALNYEAKVIREKLIQRTMEAGISVVLPGTLKTPSNIQEVVALANRYGYYVKITHVCLGASKAWMRNVTRFRSVPSSFFVASLRSYDRLADIIESKTIRADEIDIIQTGGTSPSYLAQLKRTFGRFLLSESDQELLEKLKRKEYFTF